MDIAQDNKKPATHVKRVGVKGHDGLVLGSLVSGNDNEPRGHVGVVPHLLAGRAPPREHLQDTRDGHAGKGGHVEDVVVGKEEEVMGIVEPVNRVKLVLEEVPAVVKLVND